MMQKAIEFYALSLFDCFNSNELYTLFSPLGEFLASFKVFVVVLV